MARVPFAQRDTMTPEGQQVWDEIEGSRGGVARNYAAILTRAPLKKRVVALRRAGIDPRLAIICIDPNAASRLYMSKKKEACYKKNIFLQIIFIIFTLNFF